MKPMLCALIVPMLAVLPGANAAEEGASGEAVAPEKNIKLVHGNDLENWKLFIPDESVDPATVWSVSADGVVHCTGNPAGYMRTRQKYRDYRLTFEWRWPEGPGNSGLLLHIHEPDMVWPKSIEGQLESGHAADFWSIEGGDFAERTNKEDRRVPKREDSNEKPLGEWNKYEAIADGNTIILKINGLVQNKATECTVSDGYIGLQSEGTPVEFRNIVLHPLKKKSAPAAPKQ